MVRRRRPSRTSATSLLGVLVLSLAILVVLRGCVSRGRSPSTPSAGSEPRSPAPTAVDNSPHVALGMPVDADPSDDLILDEREFVVSYNPRRLDPNWVAWRLDAQYLGHARRRDDFRADDRLPFGVRRVTPHDYTRSGYDRGHMCPSADRDADEEMNATTFVMTNMVPQLHELNAGPWEKLEARERELAGVPGAELYIVAGGVFDADPPRIGSGVAVPRATYKIIVALGPGERAVTESTRVVSVVIPNEPGVGAKPWTDFAVAVDEIERETGYDFLSKVPDPIERMLEARVGGG